MLGDWAAVLVFAVIAMAIPLSLLFATFALSTRARNGGPATSGSRSSPACRRTTFHAHRFTISYYLTAMLFIVFDIEIVFLYPLALAHARAGQWFGLAEMVMFVVLLVVAYVYVWRKGALEWR